MWPIIHWTPMKPLNIFFRSSNKFAAAEFDSCCRLLKRHCSLFCSCIHNFLYKTTLRTSYLLSVLSVGNSFGSFFTKTSQFKKCLHFLILKCTRRLHIPHKVEFNCDQNWYKLSKGLNYISIFLTIIHQYVKTIPHSFNMFRWRWICIYMYVWKFLSNKFITYPYSNLGTKWKRQNSDLVQLFGSTKLSDVLNSRKDDTSL